METNEENQLYDRQWDIVDEFYNTNQPEGFGVVVSSDEADALRAYYLIKYNDQGPYSHRERLTCENPVVVTMAKAAVHKIAVAEGLTSEEIEHLFS